MNWIPTRLWWSKYLFELGLIGESIKRPRSRGGAYEAESTWDKRIHPPTQGSNLTEIEDSLYQAIHRMCIGVLAGNKNAREGAGYWALGKFRSSAQFIITG